MKEGHVNRCIQRVGFDGKLQLRERLFVRSISFRHDVQLLSKRQSAQQEPHHYQASHNPAVKVKRPAHLHGVTIGAALEPVKLQSVCETGERKVIIEQPKGRALTRSHRSTCMAQSSLRGLFALAQPAHSCFISGQFCNMRRIRANTRLPAVHK